MLQKSIASLTSVFRSKRLFVALLIVGVVGFSLFVQQKQDPDNIPNNPLYWKPYGNIQILTSAYWQMRIKRDGEDVAYKFLAKHIEPLDDYGRHMTAHQFGNALYEAKGLDGIHVCDHRFGEGCFHQFFMSALADLGEGVVKQFSARCRAQLGEGPVVHACNHGMGHGVMVAFESRGVAGALDACGQLTDQESFHGCIDGVFMEYFTPTHTGREGDILPVRIFDPLNPYRPCNSLNARYQPTCYYMQASWWLYNEVSPERAGALCRNVPGYADVCFKSLGHAFGLGLHYKKPYALMVCKQVAKNTWEEMMCRAGAMWAFSHGNELGEHLTDDDMNLCQYSDTATARRCKDESHLSGKPIGISVICCGKYFRALEKKYAERLHAADAKKNENSIEP